MFWNDDGKLAEDTDGYRMALAMGLRPSPQAERNLARYNRLMTVLRVCHAELGIEINFVHHLRRLAFCQDPVTERLLRTAANIFQLAERDTDTKASDGGG